MVALSFVGLDQRADREAGEEGDTGEEMVIDDPIVAGEALYTQSCVSCHAADLTGGVGPALNALEGVYTPEEIVNIIHNGRGNMPAFSNLSDAEADAIAQFVLSQSQ